MDFPKHVFDLLQQQLSSTGRAGATRFFCTPTITSPTAGLISTPTSIRFTEPGIALSMYGQETDTATAVAFAQCSLRCQIGGTEDMFVDGQGGPAFAPFLALFGGVNNWTPLLRRVRPGTDWTFSFRNDTAAGTINPKIVIAVIADADLARMAASGGFQGR